MSSPTKKRTPKKLSESEKANLLHDYNEGIYSHTNLSEKYGCSKSSVQRIIKNSEINDDQQLLFETELDCKYFEYELFLCIHVCIN